MTDLNLDKVVLFGDSIITGSFSQNLGFNLAPALQDDYSCKLDVLVRGFNGYTTEMAIHLIDPLLKALHKEESEIKLLVIFFGTNDAAYGIPRSVSPERYQDNLRTIVERAHSFKISTVLVGPSLHEHTDDFDPRSSSRNRMFTAAARELSQELSVPFVDLWNEFASYLGWTEGKPIPGEASSFGLYDLKELLVDGTHFASRGYQLFYNTLKAAILESYPTLASDNIPSLIPPFKDLDPENAKQSLSSWKRPPLD
ncbi:SGNH hydrolase-type esterase domain-containing protein [Dipodascopsis uninucleata]